MDTPGMCVCVFVCVCVCVVDRLLGGATRHPVQQRPRQRCSTGPARPPITFSSGGVAGARHAAHGRGALGQGARRPAVGLVDPRVGSRPS
jgi:hypothetical protein